MPNYEVNAAENGYIQVKDKEKDEIVLTGFGEKLSDMR